MYAQTSEKEIIQIFSSQDSYKIEKSVYIYQDERNSVDFEEILKPILQKKFRKNTLESMNFGQTSAGIWLKFEVQHKDFREITDWLLSLNSPLCDYVKFYFKDKKGLWQSYHAGDAIPKKQWKMPNRNFVFPLRIEDGSVHTYYMYFATAGSMQIGLRLETPLKFSETKANNELGYGMFYGMLLMAILYNSFIYISFKDKNHLLYVIYVLMSFLAQSALSGHLSYYVLGNHPYLLSISIPVLMALANISLPLFAIYFLQVKKYTPKMYYLLWLVITFNFVDLIAAFFINSRYSISFTEFWAMLVPIILTYTTVICYQKGNKSARFFLLAWVFFIAGLLLTHLRNFGLIEVNFWTIHGFRIGLIFTVGLISLALADRYNLIRREALRMQKEANESLEQGVSERTTQLKKSNELLEQQKKEIMNQSEELKINNEQLINMDKFKQNLTSMIVHDLKNPLNAMLNISANKEGKEIWKSMQSLGNQMLHLVLNILEVQQLEEAKMDIQKDIYCFEDLVKDAIHQVNFMSEQKNIDIHIISICKARVKVDGNLIRRVIINLLSNSIKYAPQNTIIIIKIEREHNNVRISIIDEGQGIENQYLEHIFSKYVKISPKSFGKNHSTGLGLTFCKMAVEVHKGQIGVYSVYGEGATFWFKIPAYDWISKDMTNAELNFEKEASAQYTKSISKIKFLPPTQKEILKTCAIKLQEIDVYFLSEINSILDEINDKEDIKANEWKTEVQKAVSTVNESLYKSLISLVLDDEAE